MVWDNLSPIIPRGACDQVPSLSTSTRRAPSLSSSTRIVFPSSVWKKSHADPGSPGLIMTGWARRIRPGRRRNPFR